MHPVIDMCLHQKIRKKKVTHPMGGAPSTNGSNQAVPALLPNSTGPASTPTIHSQVESYNASSQLAYHQHTTKLPSPNATSSHSAYNLICLLICQAPFQRRISRNTGKSIQQSHSPHRGRDSSSSCFMPAEAATRASSTKHTPTDDTNTHGSSSASFMRRARVHASGCAGPTPQTLC